MFYIWLLWWFCVSFLNSWFCEEIESTPNHFDSFFCEWIPYFMDFIVIDFQVEDGPDLSLYSEKLSIYSSSCSYSKTDQAEIFPCMAVHAVIPRPIRREAFHVWQFMQLYQALSGLKLSIYSSSCSYPETYQDWSFPCMAAHAVIPSSIRLEACHI